MRTRSQRSISTLLIVTICWAMSGMAIAADSKPNIVVFISDDVGWRDAGCMGNTAVTTPNIDLMAETGMLFSNAFLTTPQCSPSRISILTGKYPHATGAEDLHMPLPATERLVPSYLAEAGYFNGHMRKTHYGPEGEKQFDWYSEDITKFPDFLDAAGERPFFMWVGFRDAHRSYSKGAFDPPHRPEDVLVPPYLADTPETREDLALYYDEVARMDSNIGKMRAELERRGLTENTLVIYLSDNGMPFPRAKGTVYDSGVGTPLVFSWPGVIKPGTKFEGLASVIDLAPTLLDIAGVAPEAPSDIGMQGHSILPVLEGETTTGREHVFSQRNWHNCDEHIRSVRTTRYKLIRNAYLDLPHGTAADLGKSPSFKSLLLFKKDDTLTAAQSMLFTVPRPRLELYDLKNDPWETNNIAYTDEGAMIAVELDKVIDEWGSSTGDFSPEFRRRADNTDRFTGVKFTREKPPMTHLP